MKCKLCGTEIDEAMTTCPECGAAVLDEVTTEFGLRSLSYSCNT